LGSTRIDPAYYTVADGDGQTTMAREADVDVGGDRRSAAERRASVLYRQSRLVTYSRIVKVAY
jgi:hypothetical protein